MEKNVHAGHRARLRQRVANEGLDNFQDYQVLEYVLSFVVPYKDTNPMAHRLIDKFGSFKGVLEANVEDLKTVKGLGDVSASFIASLVKVFNFYSKQNNPKEIYLTNCQQTEDFFRNIFKGKITEGFYVALVDSNGKLIVCKKVAEGNAVEVLASPRIISQYIVKYNAHNVIIAHNHPRGTAQPSKADIEFTESLIMSLAVNESKVLDHIIIGEKGEVFSFKRHGKLDERTRNLLKVIKFEKLSMSFAKYTIE